MYNFNDEERAVYEMYKANTPEETLENLKIGLAAAPEETKDIILAVIKRL
ncbi:MAG: hypothetical protein GX663_02750 [Clostridiales bacterium]|nr:hypothetical protein [Clostridiales bacterium]